MVELAVLDMRVRWLLNSVKSVSQVFSGKSMIARRFLNKIIGNRYNMVCGVMAVVYLII